jgi:hypothetical protein
MTRFDLLSRLITAAALVALAVTLGVWLNRPPLTTAPDAPLPVKTIPEPILAPPPAPSTVTATIIEVPVEVEIAAATEPPTVTTAQPKSKLKPACPPLRRGLFRRR